LTAAVSYTLPGLTSPFFPFTRVIQGVISFDGHKETRKMTNRLLLVDDESEIRDLAVDFFGSVGYHLDLAISGNEAIARLEDLDYDVVITDLIMPDGDGKKVVSWIVENKPYTGVVVMTGYGSVESAVSLMKMGAADYILKPFMLDELKVVVDRCISNQGLREENRLLQEAYARMQEVKNMKEKFLALTSHELKTPVTILNTMLGFIEQKTDSECGIREQLALMKKTVGNLTETITEMQQLAQSQEDTIPMHYQEVNLLDIIDDVVHDIQLLAADRQLEIIVNREEESGANTLIVDAEKIRRVLFELLQNAVKFTPDQGSITVAISREPAREDELPRLLIHITDTGIGIAAADHEKIFEKFYKIQDAHSHHSSASAFLGGGLGIGLSLARNLVEIQQGRISLTSDYDNGSTFTISLPCRESVPSR